MSPSGLEGLSGADVSLGKPDLTRGSSTPSGPWELGPLGALLFLVVALAAITYGFASDRAHRENDPADQAARGALVATSANSFTNASRLSKALALLEAKTPASARLQVLSVLPSELEGTMVDRDGLEIHFDVDASMNATAENTGDGLDGRGIALRSVPAGAPSRILNAAEQKFQLNPQHLMTFDLSGSSGPANPSRWTVEYTGPSSHNRVQAKLDGTHVQLSGGS